MQQEFADETRFSLARTVPVPNERRRDERYMTILRVGTLIRGETRELCLMRNISGGGVMALAYSRMEPGERLAVEFKSNQQIAGRVAWVRDDNVGIEFDEAMDVAELLSNPAVLDNGWRPRMPRVEIDRMATLRAGARTYWVQVRDISLGGIKAETGQPIEEGLEVVLVLENFRPVAGIVRWQKDGCCGVKFNQHLAFAELMEWLKRES